MSSKQPTNDRIILHESDKIVTDEQIICHNFNDYFSNVAKEIGFDDEIPDDFQVADGFAKLIDKHSSHPSILKVKEHSSTQRSFLFRDIYGSEVEKMIKTMNPKKAQGLIMYPASYYVWALQVLLIIYIVLYITHYNYVFSQICSN